MLLVLRLIEGFVRGMCVRDQSNCRLVSELRPISGSSISAHKRPRLQDEAHAGENVAHKSVHF